MAAGVDPTDIATLVRQLRVLGVDPHRPLLVHTSLRAVGPVVGGAAGLAAALLEVSAHSALLVPALSYDQIDWEAPRFEVEHTPSCVGAFPEYFRHRADAQRSYHITHSVCASGPDAGVFVADHHLDDSPGGPRSPFTKNIDADGQILMLGCGLGPNTTMHAIEEMCEPPYLFLPGVFDYEITTPGGGIVHARTRRHDFTGYAQRYDRVAAVPMPEGAIRTGEAGLATAHLIQAAALRDAVLAVLKDDPLWFVERAESARDA